MTETPENAAQPIGDDVADELKQQLMDMLLMRPEIRSLMCIIDYRGVLNDLPGARTAVWIGDGPNSVVLEPAAILGTLFNTLRAVQHIVSRAQMYSENLHSEILNATKELQNLESQLRGGAQPGPEHQGDPAGTPGPG